MGSITTFISYNKSSNNISTSLGSLSSARRTILVTAWPQIVRGEDMIKHLYCLYLFYRYLIGDVLNETRYNTVCENIKSNFIRRMKLAQYFWKVATAWNKNSPNHDESLGNNKR